MNRSIDNYRAGIAPNPLDIRSIFVLGSRWFDKVNGNTYHRAEVWIDGISIGYVAEYGYGLMYLQSAAELLDESGLLPPREAFPSGAKRSLSEHCRAHGISFDSREVKCLKRDLGAWGLHVDAEAVSRLHKGE
jgi:hypothetical protein